MFFNTRPTAPKPLSEEIIKKLKAKANIIEYWKKRKEEIRISAEKELAVIDDRIKELLNEMHKINPPMPPCSEEGGGLKGASQMAKEATESVINVNIKDGTRLKITIEND